MLQESPDFALTDRLGASASTSEEGRALTRPVTARKREAMANFIFSLIVVFLMKSGKRVDDSGDVLQSRVPSMGTWLTFYTQIRVISKASVDSVERIEPLEVIISVNVAY